MNSIEEQKREIIAYIKKNIKVKQFNQDGKIPSENKLSSMFNVNRNTVRGALAVLKAQGIIYSIKGKGFFVSAQPSHIIFEQDKSLGFSEILNKGTNNYSGIVLNVKLGFPTKKERKILNLEEGEKVYYLKQLRAKRNNPFAVCLSVMPQRLVPDIDKYLDNFSGTNNILLNTYHYPHSTCKWLLLTADLPTRQDIELLNISDNIPILKQENLFSIEGLGNIEYFIVRARGDTFQYKMDFQ